MLTQKNASLIVAVLILIFILFFSIFCFLKFQYFVYKDFDLAVHSQSVWNIIHGSCHSSILGFSFLGNHFQPILFFCALFYLIIPSALTLIILQVVAVGCGAIFVYLLAREKLSPDFGVVFVFCYLLYPALGHVLLFEFHPVSFAIPLLFGAYYFFERRTYVWCMVFLLAAMMCKENVPLMVSMFGVLALIRRRAWGWAMVFFFSGLLWFIAVTGYVMPLLNDGNISYGMLYAHLGASPGEWAAQILGHPLKIIMFMSSPAKRTFLHSLFVPLGYVSLLSPSGLFLAVPIFAQRLLSNRTSDCQIFFHYTALLIPCMFISAISATGRLLAWPRLGEHRRQWIAILLICSTVASFFLYGIIERLQQESLPMRDHPRAEAMRWLCETVGSSARVMSTFEFLPRLSPREHIYSFHNTCQGKYTLSNRDYTPPSDLDYLLINEMDATMLWSYGSPERLNRIRHFLNQRNWAITQAVESFFLLEPEAIATFNPYKRMPRDQEGEVVKARFVQDILLLDYTFEEQRVANWKIVEITTDWAVNHALARPLLAEYRFHDEQGALVRTVLHPLGSWIYPTGQWSTEECVRDRFRLIIPDDYGDRPYRITLRLLTARHRIPLPYSSAGKKDPSISDKFTFCLK